MTESEELQICEKMIGFAKRLKWDIVVPQGTEKEKVSGFIMCSKEFFDRFLSSAQTEWVQLRLTPPEVN